MKKLTILLLSMSLILNTSYGQMYRNLFDKLNQTYFTGVNPSFYTNIYTHLLHNDASTVMESYIVMYKATGDKKYLNNFIIYAKRIQELRDDNILNVENSGALQGLPHTDTQGCTTSSMTEIQGFPGSYKGWTANFKRRGTDPCVRYPHYMESGTICFPMAEFIYLMRTNSSLNNEPVPTEVNSAQTPSTVYGSNLITNYLQFADWLENRIHETISWHSDNQLQGADAFKADGQIGALNQQCAIGRLIALMYQISVVEGNPIIDYLTITERIATIDFI